MTAKTARPRSSWRTTIRLLLSKKESQVFRRSRVCARDDSLVKGVKEKKQKISGVLFFFLLLHLEKVTVIE